ncbi:MAG TPA: hypothetical protein VF604_15250 [Pyrinomonadaceae bacterium]
MKITSLKLYLLFILVNTLFVQGCFSNTSNQNNATDTNTPNNPPTFNESTVAKVNESAVAKVKVTQSGKIFLNDKRVSLDELKKALERLGRENGVVWYYQENSQNEQPHPRAAFVVKAIVDADLPAKVSSKPDYSDSIEMKGKSNASR